MTRPEATFQEFVDAVDPPKKTRLIGERVTSAVDRIQIRERHAPRPRYPRHCPICGQEAPCDAIIVLDDLEKTEAAFRRLVTWPF